MGLIYMEEGTNLNVHLLQGWGCIRFFQKLIHFNLDAENASSLESLKSILVQTPESSLQLFSAMLLIIIESDHSLLHSVGVKEQTLDGTVMTIGLILNKETTQ